MVVSEVFCVKTDKDFTDITDIVRGIVAKSGIKNGIVNVFPQHTTVCVKIMENEILSLCDVHDHLEAHVPKNGNYKHDKIGLRDVPPDERINGHSHVKTLYFQTSETAPVKDGKVDLGKWQSIMLAELDPARERSVLVTVMGE